MSAKSKTSNPKTHGATAVKDAPARAKCATMTIYTDEKNEVTYLKAETQDGGAYWNKVGMPTTATTFRDTLDRGVRSFNAGNGGWKEEADDTPEDVTAVAVYKAKTGTHSWLASDGEGDEQAKTGKAPKTSRAPLRGIKPEDATDAASLGNKTAAIKELKKRGYTANEIAKGMDYHAGFTYNVWNGITSAKPQSAKLKLSDDDIKAIVAHFTMQLLVDTGIAQGLADVLVKIAESPYATDEFKENLAVAQKLQSNAKTGQDES